MMFEGAERKDPSKQSLTKDLLGVFPYCLGFLRSYAPTLLFLDIPLG